MRYRRGNRFGLRRLSVRFFIIVTAVDLSAFQSAVILIRASNTHTESIRGKEFVIVLVEVCRSFYPITLDRLIRSGTLPSITIRRRLLRTSFLPTCNDVLDIHSFLFTTLTLFTGRVTKSPTVKVLDYTSVHVADLKLEIRVHSSIVFAPRCPRQFVLRVRLISRLSLC